jgi:hypothetical protein
LRPPAQDADVGFLNRSWWRMFALALQAGLEINQTFARFHQCHQLLMRGIVGLNRRFVKCRGEPGNHLGIDRIVFCQPSGEQCKATDPLGINNPHIDAGQAQSLGPVPFIAAARSARI